MNRDAFGWLGCLVNFALTLEQTNELFQVISLILTILSTLTVLAYTIWKWYKKAKADGKVSKEEVEKLMNNLTNTKDDDD